MKMKSTSTPTLGEVKQELEAAVYQTRAVLELYADQLAEYREEHWDDAGKGSSASGILELMYATRDRLQAAFDKLDTLEMAVARQALGLTPKPN